MTGMSNATRQLLSALGNLGGGESQSQSFNCARQNPLFTLEQSRTQNI
jgi:hypothetical protein